jgi:phosphoglycolate phosphatase-like HAD superfamily hydrolase
VTSPPTRSFLPNTHIEIVNPDVPRRGFRHALLDFDGTVSLLRAGWPDVMVPMMVDVLAELNTGESRDELTEVVREFVYRLTGKQTIYQMIELAEQVKRRGGSPRDPLEYKRQYLALLWEHIKDRVEGLKSGRFAPEQMAVPGAFDLIENLHRRGVKLYLASGTDRPYVLDEAQALGLTKYFGDDIYGAVDDYKTYSKRLVIQRIIAEHNLSGPEFAAFGDGYVEIEDAKAVGGIAIGAAVDEYQQTPIDSWKRERLIRAGTDVIVPDWREQKTLVAWLFGEVQ